MERKLRLFRSQGENGGDLLIIEGEFQKAWSKYFREWAEGLYGDVTRRPLVFLC